MQHDPLSEAWMNLNGVWGQSDQGERDWLVGIIRKIKNFLKDLAALILLNSDFKHILS
jgi:hypothetical protein